MERQSTLKMRNKLQTPKRQLIVNADDFGLSPGINRGVIEAHEHGIVTSTSMMVRWPSAVAAAAYAKQHPHLSVGLHLDFCEWSYLNNNWTPVYQVVDLKDAAAVAEEVRQQFALFRQMMGREPTHLDSHQHTHLEEPLLAITTERAARLGISLRCRSPRVSYSGKFYGQSGKGEPYPPGISVEGMLNVLRELPPGITELGCHPGVEDEMETTYHEERLQELQVLCDPRVRAAIEKQGIQLCSFHDLVDK